MDLLYTVNWAFAIINSLLLDVIIVLQELKLDMLHLQGLHQLGALLLQMAT